MTWCDEWIVKERLTQKLLESEESRIGDADGVHVLGWSASKARPRLHVFDPGFYFPDTQTSVQGWDDDEFPPIVHLAWEWQGDDGKTWIHRKTWRMAPLEVPVSTPWRSTRSWTCWYREVDYDAYERYANANVYAPELTPRQHRQLLTAPETADGWVDMLVAFIPVVHVPNDPFTQSGWVPASVSAVQAT